MPQTSNSLLSPTKFLVASGNHLRTPLCTPFMHPSALGMPYMHFMIGKGAPPQPITALHMLYAHLMHTFHAPYAHLTHALHKVYEWLRVPTTANYSITRALRAPYVCLMCTLCAVYEWLRVPTTANHSNMCTLCTPYTCLTHSL